MSLFRSLLQPSNLEVRLGRRKNEMLWSHIVYPDETGRSKVIAGLGALRVITNGLPGYTG